MTLNRCIIVSSLVEKEYLRKETTREKKDTSDIRKEKELRKDSRREKRDA